MPVFLVREPKNPHDPNAVAVLAPWGAPLGYLHRPLAAVLSARIDAGEAFSACVATILGEACDPDERLHVEVWQDTLPGKVCFIIEKPVEKALESREKRKE